MCEPHYRRRRRTGSVDAERPVGEYVARPCTVDDCDSVATERGLCHGHYLRMIRLGNVHAERPLVPMANDRCSVDGCERLVYARHLCPPHYRRLLKSGDPQPHKPLRIPTGDRYLHHGYWVVSVPRELRHLTDGHTPYLEHRFVMAQMLGRALFADESVHHRNGDRRDNRPANLELWSRWQPRGQRTVDKIEWALEVLTRYAPERLRKRE